MRSFLFLFGRSLLQRLIESHAAHEVASGAMNARIVELERALATEKSRFEWLSAHVNELKTERAILLERVLGIQVPVMQIAREDAPPATVAAPRRLTPEDLRNDVAYVAPQGERGQVLRRSVAEPKDATALMAEALAAGDLFNDVGDARAREMGLGWDEEGRLATDLPPAVASR